MSLEHDVVEISKLSEDSIDPMSISPLSHKPENVEGIWWYSLQTGELRVTDDPTKNHQDPMFADIAHKPGWTKGRVSKISGKNFLTIYSNRNMLDRQYADLIYKLENWLDVRIDRVVDMKGNDLYKIIESLGSEILSTFHVGPFVESRPYEL